MRILLFHRIRGTGADGTHIRGVAGGFRKLGHMVDIISPWGVDIEKETKSSGESVRKRRNALLQIPRVFFELLEIAYNLPAFFRLLFYVLRWGYDAIYERYAFFNIAGLLISSIARIPLFLEVNFTTRTQVYPRRTSALGPLNRWVEKRLFDYATVIVVVSEELKADIERAGIQKKKILVLPNAVDADKFSPRSAVDRLKAKFDLEGKMVLGFVGSFYPWHGGDFLLDVFQEISDCQENAVVMLIGDGQMLPAMRDRVSKGDSGDKILFTGAVNHSELPDYLSCFDIGSMPDSNNYGSPMKIFEYMAMGIPIVAPRLPPIEAVIEDGVQGFLFRRRDPEDLKQALLRLFGDRSLRERMGKEGRDKVMKEHTWERNIQKLISFKNDLM